MSRKYAYLVIDTEHDGQHKSFNVRVDLEGGDRCIINALSESGAYAYIESLDDASPRYIDGNGPMIPQVVNMIFDVLSGNNYRNRTMAVDNHTDLHVHVKK